MNVHGLQALLEMRQARRRPADAIMLTLTDSEGVIRPSDNIETIDLRPLLGLSVIVCADTFGERENRLFLRLQEYAADVVLYVTEWVRQGGNEFGLSWQRGSETKPFPEAA